VIRFIPVCAILSALWLMEWSFLKFCIRFFPLKTFDS
jgi:hypothetical protein